MQGGDLGVGILGDEAYDQHFSIDMDVTTSEHVPMIWTDKVLIPIEISSAIN